MATKKLISPNGLSGAITDLTQSVITQRTEIAELQKILEAQTIELEQQRAMIRNLQNVPISREKPVDWNNWFETTSASPNAEDVPMLHKAEELINGARQQDYGDKLQNFSQIAMLWQGLLATKLQFGTFITAEDVALCMMAVKMARLAKSPDHSDSILDVAGYAGCYDKLQQERKKGVKLEGAICDTRNGTS